MKKIQLSILLAIIALCFSETAKAQVFIKTEYISSTSYQHDDYPDQIGEGGLKKIQAGLNLPVSVKVDEYGRNREWSIFAYGAYCKSDNKGLAYDLCPDKITNMQIRGMYRGSLNQKWSIMATLGAAAYTTGTLSDTRWNNIVATGSVAFIRHLRPNLDLGFGASVNTMLGYPMPFPVFFIEWRLQNWYFVDLSFGDAVRAKIGTNFTNYFTLSVAAEMGGTMALDRLENRDMIFMEQYCNVGLQPEFKFGKVSIPITLGVTPFRNAYYKEKTLKAMFEEKKEDEQYPHYKVGFYCSASVIWKF